MISINNTYKVGDTVIGIYGYDSNKWDKNGVWLKGSVNFEIVDGKLFVITLGRNSEPVERELLIDLFECQDCENGQIYDSFDEVWYECPECEGYTS